MRKLGSRRLAELHSDASVNHGRTRIIDNPFVSHSCGFKPLNRTSDDAISHKLIWWPGVWFQNKWQIFCENYFKTMPNQESKFYRFSNFCLSAWKFVSRWWARNGSLESICLFLKKNTLFARTNQLYHGQERIGVDCA